MTDEKVDKYDPTQFEGAEAQSNIAALLLLFRMKIFPAGQGPIDATLRSNMRRAEAEKLRQTPKKT